MARSLVSCAGSSLVAGSACWRRTGSISGANPGIRVRRVPVAGAHLRRRSLRPRAEGHAPAAFFLARRAQQVARAVIAQVPLADVLTGTAMVGGFVLWALALNLLGEWLTR